MSGPPTFAKVATVADLDTLSDDDILAGYRAGRDGDPEPGHNHGRAYWHGWRNGMMDSGRLKHDTASSQLVTEYAARERARTTPGTVQETERASVEVREVLP